LLTFLSSEKSQARLNDVVGQARPAGQRGIGKNSAVCLRRKAGLYFKSLTGCAVVVCIAAIPGLKPGVIHM
jgi:hypothetical protein